MIGSLTGEGIVIVLRQDLGLTKTNILSVGRGPARMGYSIGKGGNSIISFSLSSLLEQGTKIRGDDFLPTQHLETQRQNYKTRTVACPKRSRQNHYGS